MFVRASIFAIANPGAPGGALSTRTRSCSTLPCAPLRRRGRVGIKSSPKRRKHVEAIVLSMTKEERKTPNLINGSRRARISKGSGRPVNEINRLLEQFREMQKMMKKMSGGGGKGGAMPRMPFGGGGGGMFGMR